MVHCSVLWCKKSSKTSSVNTDGVSFYGFPKDPVVKRKWIERTKRDENWYPTKNHRICSIHFNPKCVMANANGRRRLRDDSVPSLFIPTFTQYHGEEQPSTSTAGVSNKAAAFYEKSVALVADDDEDSVESEQQMLPVDVHYTSSKESQKGKVRLSAGTLFPETPKYCLSQELMMDLHELSDKIQNFYPAVLGKQFTLAFQGEDGDKSEYIFTSASATRRNGEHHRSLHCNECGSDIIGFRYKCVSCADYDLCYACETLGLHAEHLMMRIAKPIKLKRARTLLQQWCESLMAAGITTAEDITPGQDEDPEPEHQQPSCSTNKSLILDPHPRGTFSTKAAKWKATSKGKAKATKKSTPEDEPKKNEAKKIKIEEAPERYDTIVTEVPIKEETIEDFYHSLSETNETNEIEIFINTEKIKLEDPDPLGIEKIKTEDTEMDITLSTTPLGDPGPATMTSEHPGPPTMTSGYPGIPTLTSGYPTITSGHSGPLTTAREHPGPLTITSGHPGPATTAREHPGPLTITSRHPGPATTAREHPGPLIITSGHPGPATTAREHPGPLTITGRHPGPATTAREHPGPPAITSGHPGPATTDREHPGPLTITSGHSGPLTTAREHPGPLTITSGHPGPATTVREHPAPLTITSGHPGLPQRPENTPDPSL